MSDDLERAADALEAEWYLAGPPRPREPRVDADKWDGVVFGPPGFVFFCRVCEQAVTVPHDTNVCNPPTT